MSRNETEPLKSALKGFNPGIHNLTAWDLVAVEVLIRRELGQETSTYKIEPSSLNGTLAKVGEMRGV